MKTAFLYTLAAATVLLVGCSSIDTTGNNNPNAIPTEPGVAGTGGGGGGGGPSTHGIQKQLP